jgi:hypothetical protein
MHLVQIIKYCSDTRYNWFFPGDVVFLLKEKRNVYNYTCWFLKFDGKVSKVCFDYREGEFYESFKC